MLSQTKRGKGGAEATAGQQVNKNHEWGEAEEEGLMVSKEKVKKFLKGC